MKKLKISLVAIFAVMLGIVGSSFTVKEVTASGSHHYKYSGADNQGLLIESNWTETQFPDVVACPESSGLNCIMEIEVDPDGSGHPVDLSGFSEQQINTATVAWQEE